MARRRKIVLALRASTSAGVREGALALFLQPLGVPPGRAVALGLAIYGVNLTASLLGAPAFALGARRSLRVAA